MAAYDAEIRVKTKVDNGDVIKLEAVLNEAEKQADDLGDAMKDVQLNRETAEAAQQAATAVNHLERETRKAASAAGELEDAWKNTKIHLNDGSTLDWDGNVIEEAVKDTAALNREQSGLADTAARAAEAMRRMGEETRAANAAAYGTDAAETEKELTPVQNMLLFIKKSFQDIPLLFGGIADKFTAKTRRMEDEWDNLSNRADAYKRILKELENEDKGFGDREYDEAYKEWQKAEQAVREYKKQLTGAKKQHISLLQGMKNLRQTVSGAFRKMTAVVKKFFSSTQSGAKKTGGMLGTMASRMKGLALSLLFFNWISKGFNAMVSGMKNGFKALSGYSREYASSVQTLKNALGTLGNSFASAFAPIVRTVIPYLVELINWVTRAINAVAQLIAYLSGKSTWTKATEVQNGYSDALNGTASAAKKAAGALAKFDDLDVLQKKDTVGGGGGATGGFEEVPIDSEIKSFWDKIKNMWDEADFSDWGKMLADRINEFLEGIDWESIRETARKLGRSLATFLNGIIENLDWKLLGRTIAQGINTAFEFAFGFLRDFNWAAFGQGLANLINGAMQGLDWLLIYNTIIMGAYGIAKAINNFVATLNWAELGRTLANGINVAVDGLIAFLTAVDWKKMGTKIGLFLRKAIENIEWKDIGRALGMIIQKAVDFVGSILDEMNWDEVKQAIKDLFEGFSEEIKDVPDWIKNLAGAFLMFKAGSAVYNAVKFLTESLKAFAPFAGQTILITVAFAVAGAYKEAFDLLDKYENGSADEKREIEINWAGNRNEATADPWTRYGQQADATQFWETQIGKLKEWQDENRQKRDEEKAEWDTWFDGLSESFLSFWSEKKDGFLEWQTENRKKRDEEKGEFDTWFEELSASFATGLDNVKATIQTKWQEICSWWNESAFVAWWEEIVAPWFTAEKWSELWVGVNEAFDTCWASIVDWWQNTALYTWWEENVAPWFTPERWGEQLQNVKDSFKTKWDETVGQWKTDIKNWWDNHVAPWFTKNRWLELGENMKKGIYEGFKGIVNKVVDTLNGVIEALEGMINLAIEGLNSLLDKVNGSSLGKSLGANLHVGNVSFGRIPHLATGAVIRGGNPFMAVLGDQPSGQTNIEAPLSTIREAVREELSGLNFGNGGQAKVVLRLNGQDVGEAIVEDLLSVMNRKGYDVEVLGVT